MHSSSRFRLTVLLVFLGLAGVPALAQQDPAQQPSGDPVADAARKARAEQKTAPKPKKVFTNDDMPAASTTPSATGTGNSSAQKGQASDEVNPDNDPKSEVYWRKRFQKQRDKIAQSETELDVLQRELNKDQVQYYNDPQKALTQQYSRSDINDKTAKIDAKKKELDALKQGLSDMEDELRKAGGDPGWAR
jgi:hypothetical protein